MKHYFRSDVVSFTVGPTGHVHVPEPDDTGRRCIDCATCEPYLMDLGGVRDFRAVPLTYDEQQELEKQRVQTEVTSREMARAMAEAAAGIISARGAVPTAEPAPAPAPAKRSRTRKAN